MTIVFWMAAAAGLAFLVLWCLAGMFMDSWGEKLIPLIVLTGIIAVADTAIFAVWFAMDALSITVTVGSEP